MANLNGRIARLEEAAPDPRRHPIKIAGPDGQEVILAATLPYPLIIKIIYVEYQEDYLDSKSTNQD